MNELNQLDAICPYIQKIGKFWFATYSYGKNGDHNYVNDAKTKDDLMKKLIIRIVKKERGE